jgi:hypothetical protein
MTSALLTPFSTADAVELGNRLWRKKVLPVGDVEYKGRLLHFTRDYLGQLAQAFQNRAYDQVPFQLADAANTHTNDPERTRGEIESMELGDDGLYVTARVNEAGEQVLAANPKLGVSARIVEDYARSDGKHFPAAIQHVLGTLDPRIPGLGAWQAIEAASPEPDQVIDFSGASYPGEELSPDGSPPAFSSAVVELVGPEGFSHGWIFHGTDGAAPEDKADRMSKNISGHSFKDGPDGAEAQSAHKEAAKAHRQAAKLSSSPSAVAHHQSMAKLHSAVASGRMESYSAQKKMDLAGDGTDLEGAPGMADLNSLTDEQKQRLVKLLEIPDEQLDQLANGGLVLTPEELEALTTPDAGEDEAEDEDPLAAEIAAMTDEEIAALEAEFDAGSGAAQEQVPEREPVAAGLSAEAQFSIDLANARADETARELSVIQARLREEDFLSEKRRLADLGVPPYLTELARPLLEGAGHAVELANGSTVDAGAIMRRVLSEYARQVKLLDLDVELGSPMDEPEGAGDGEAEQSRASLVARMKSATGLK